MPRVVLVRHGREPTPDRIQQHLAGGPFDVDNRYPFDGEPLGAMDEDVVATVVYGGMYNAYDTDKHPFLRDEYNWIDQALKRDLPLLGICQGAQMIAHHLGAYAGAPDHGQCEFGYCEVEPVPGAETFLPRTQRFAQAHFHGFDLPAGAAHLARSAVYPNQAFRIGRAVYGFQFHPEVTRTIFARWQQDNALFAMQGAQSRDEQDRLGAIHDPQQAEWFETFLNHWLPGESG